MIDPRLVRQLKGPAWRIRQLYLGTSLAAVWLVAALIGVTLLGLNWWLGWYAQYLPAILGVAGLAAAGWVGWRVVRSTRDYRRVAQQVETACPELKSCLLTAVEQQPALPDGRFGFLQHTVIRAALRHGYVHGWHRAVPLPRVLVAHTANLLALASFVAVLVALGTYMVPGRSEGRGSPFGYEGDGSYLVTVEPGDTEVERGSSLLVMARFGQAVPPEATLVCETDAGEQVLPMSRSLDDPVFAGRITSVDGRLTYRVAYADQNTREYQVDVFDRPSLVRADAKLVYPEYTSLEERLVQEVQSVSAVEGTELTLICHLNKHVAEARLVPKKGEPIELLADDGGPIVYRAEMKLDKTQRLELQLVDEHGRTNKRPPEFLVQVTPNKPPDLKLVLPSRDVQVSPLEELDLKANAWDDYGLSQYGVSYAMAGDQPKDAVLGESVAGKNRVDFKHVVFFEELDAEPDQLLSYHFWAEDTGPDGKARRTQSDMYFAEVRHFEEIFRQGQAPAGGESQQQQQQQQAGGNAQAANQLAELQKQIINATWKLIRRESEDAPSSGFGEDVKLIAESQTSAIEQVNSLSGNIQDPQSKSHVDEVTRHMTEALEHLTRAKVDSAVSSLQPALAAEQAAYQALLRLRAREHRVIRTNSQQAGRSSSSSSGRSQQQLQQLELSQDENRYETQRTAQAPQEEQQERETRQVLNRLRELARRQSDLNDRLKELQSALQTAQTEQQREEIRRQLKRLRDEQQQIMRDTDQLQARMERPENQERMNDARQQLDQTRDNVRQASEALREGMVSRAAAAGTRAEREFRELRDEFRNQASGQFAEQMREMRENARELDESQRNLGERLAEVGETDPNRQSLRGTPERQQLEDDLQQQRKRLGGLLDQMRQTVEKAEVPEPLLAEQLYDTVRTTEQQNLDRALDATSQSILRGFLDDAREREGVAREGIQQLRQGVEQAAERVLGDETERLRRAQEELNRLTEQLRDEIARQQRGEDSAESPDDSQAASSRSSGDRPENSQRDSADPQSPGGRGEQATSDEIARQQQGDRSDSPGDSQTASSRPPGDRPEDSRRDSANSRSLAGRGERAESPSRSGNPGGLGGFERFLDDASPTYAPISGDDFPDWSDRLRDVEEMIEDTELRAEAARIRDRARGIRIDLKRHSKPPSWDLVQLKVCEPLIQLRDRVAEELLKRSSTDALVPIDRDPVPPKYAEQVRRYYQRLGSGK